MGRPSIIVKHAPAVLEALDKGLTHKRAADYAGISVGTLQMWLQKGRAAPHGQYREFADSVAKTEASQIKRLMGTIETASERTWAAAAWILERRYGYHRPPSTHVEATVNVPAPDSAQAPTLNSKAGREELVQALMELPQDLLLESLRRAKAVELAKKGERKKGK